MQLVIGQGMKFALAGLIAGAVVAAGMIPARRALLVGPASALRFE